MSSYIEENGYFVFDGIKSSDYGVWISGGGTFNAPKRRYKDYTVPGRNGTLTIDEGVFEEIEVVYPAFIARDFPANIEAFRNQLMSRSGYVRMTDSYHPDEYYMAKYMDGLEADVLAGGVGGQFNLTFRRDPRRFLVSGETPISVSSSGSITNPTLFKSRPQIKITVGTNLISFTGGTATVDGINFVSDGTTIIATGTATAAVMYEVDAFWLPAGTYTLSGTQHTGTTARLLVSKFGGGTLATDTGDGATFTTSENMNVKVWVSIVNGDTVDTSFTPKLIAATTGAKTVTIGSQTITINSVGDYVIVDSEIQSCYRGTNNLNSQVIFSPNDFPTLAPGANNIAYSDGIGSVEITPNWYRV